jgi:hypothetical protein
LARRSWPPAANGSALLGVNDEIDVEGLKELYECGINADLDVRAVD